MRLKIDMLRVRTETIRMTRMVWERWFAGKSVPEDPMALLPGQLISFSEGVAAESSGVEGDFLWLGNELQKTHGEATALIRNACDTVTQVNGEGGLLNRIDGVVHQALTDLRACRDKVTAEVVSFAKGADLMENLYSLCRTIDKMVLQLQMVGLNIGVESMRTSEGQELFAVVATDVRELSKKVAGIAENIRSGALSAWELQEKANREITEDILRMSTVAADAEAMVQEVMKDIRNLMAFSTAAMHQASEHSREISKWIGTLVEGIQFHDNMHQRISHIGEALRELSSRSVAPASETPGENPHIEEMQHAHAVITLQAAQLKQVIREVDKAHVGATRAFDEITRHVGELAQSLSSFRFDSIPEAALRQGVSAAPLSSESSADAKQLFTELSTVIERFKALLKQGEGLNKRMQETFGQASASAGRLSDAAAQVRKINFEIHLLALNAVVKAAHMGSEGRALEVLAHAVQDLSAQSNGFVVQVGSLLDEIILTARSEEPEREGESGCSARMNGADMRAENLDIMDAHDTINRMSMDIVLRGEAMMEALSGARGRLSFLRDLKERLDLRHQDLLSCSTVLSPFAGGGSGSTDRLKARYTMDQERAVHEQRTAEAMGCQQELLPYAKVDSPPGASSTEGELGDNVELF